MTEDHVDDTERWALTRAGLQHAGGPGSVTPPGLLRIAAERLRQLRMGHDDRMTGGQPDHCGNDCRGRREFVTDEDTGEVYEQQANDGSQSRLLVTGHHLSLRHLRLSNF